MERRATNGNRSAQSRHRGEDRESRAREEVPHNGGLRNGGGMRNEREPDNPQSAPRRRLSGSAAAEYAKAHLLDLTGESCEAISSLMRTREGWRVVLEIVELERIPRTTDILASYRIDLDEEGDLMGYERIRRYSRNDVDGES
jgi:hypothetical protein